VAVLPNTEKSGLMTVCERVRANVASMKIPHRHSKAADVITVSIKACCFHPHEKLDIEQAVDLIDQALYQAK